jgi:hypothetical protein
MDQDFLDDLARGEVDDADRSLVGDEAHGIDLDQGAPAGRAGHVAGLGTAAAPVADIGLAADQDDIERRDADIPDPQDAAVGGIELGQAVGQIEGGIELRPVAGDGQAGGDLLLAAGRPGQGQGERAEGLDRAVGLDPEDLDAAVDVAQVDPPAVRGVDTLGYSTIILDARTSCHPAPANVIAAFAGLTGAQLHRVSG